MKTYVAPELVEFGGIAQITGLTGHVSEQDTIIDRNGGVSHLPGPESQIFCEDTDPRDGICDHEQ